MHFDVAGSPALKADGTPAPQSAHDHAHAPSPSSEIGTASAVIAISNFEFAPEAVRLRAGGSVTWENHDSVAHHVIVTLDGKEQQHALPPHGRVTVTFLQTGRFTYHCLPHPFMQGTVEVE